MEATDEVVREIREACFYKVEPKLHAMPSDMLTQPNVDLQAAAMAALVLVDKVRLPVRTALFALLHPKIFAPNNIDDLETTAHAALYVDVQSLTEGAASKTVKVDVKIIEEGTLLKARMILTTSYHLKDIEAAMRQIRDIIPGTGYFDLANDLSRLAGLYVTYKSELEGDKRYYNPADATNALRIANAIYAEYRAASSRSNPYLDLRVRVYAELSRLYNDVRDTAAYLFRADADALDDFPPLRSSVGIFSPPRPKKEPETTTEVKPPKKEDDKPTETKEEPTKEDPTAAVPAPATAAVAEPEPTAAEKGKTAAAKAK